MACSCKGSPPAGICPECGACGPLAKEEFLRLWREILPASYTAPIEEEGSGRGFDVPSSHASIWACFTEAIEVSQQAYYLRRFSGATRPWSSGGQKASGTVNAFRAAPVNGDIVLHSGTTLLAVVTNSFGERNVLGRYLVAEDTTLPEGNSGPIEVPIESEFEGYTGNVQAEVITEFQKKGRREIPSTVTSTTTIEQVSTGATADDRLNESLVDRYFRFSGVLQSENASLPRRVTSFTDTDPPSITFEPALDDSADVGASITMEVEEFEDFGITIEQPEEICGGRSPVLDAIGADRNRGRAGDEGDEEYRTRLIEIGDKVSPNAIRRILTCSFGVCGISFVISETREVDSLMGFTWDEHPFDFGEVRPVGKPPGSEYTGQGGVFLSESSQTRFFIVTIGCESVDAAIGLSYDDGPLPAAWDGDQPYDGDDVFGDIGYNECVAQAWEDVNSARAAGVAFLFVQDCDL